MHIIVSTVPNERVSWDQTGALAYFHVSVVNRDAPCCCPFPPSNKLSAAVTTDVMAVKAAIQGNLQRDRGLRAVMETSFGLLILVVLSPRLAWIFGIIIPLTAWGLVRGGKQGFPLGLIGRGSTGLRGY